MSDLKDSAIKLFGKTIPLPVPFNDLSSAIKSSAACEDSRDHNSTTSVPQNRPHIEQEEQEGKREKEITDGKEEDGNSNQITDESRGPTSLGISEPVSPSAEIETSSPRSYKNGEQIKTSVSQEKTMRKPDKTLPCPRCNSMDTKFCYYNNYNVNQPRHFCKNCQRYWTAGGSMRNVPVGAGRRKNKSSSASHYRHLIISEALRTAQAHALNGVQNPCLGNNSTVLTFGSESPFCESVASVLNLSEKTQNIVRNWCHRPEPKILVPCGGGGDERDDQSSASPVTALNSSKKGGNDQAGTKKYQRFTPDVPCIPGPPWPCAWNSAMPSPTFCPSGFPVSFYPPPTYRGCTVPRPWNASSCIYPPSPTLTHSTPNSSPTSPLGKHSRDGSIELSRESNRSEKRVLVPKTLRIDDPSEAAKSSIWATLGLKSEKSSSINGGLFKGFQLKSEDRNCVAEKSPALQANPAALSRSLNFHESA